MAPTHATMISNSFDIKTLIVDEGYGVKGLSDMDIKNLPKQYVQPLEECFTNTTLISKESIPIIDISNWNDPKVADMVCDAAEKLGFFQIINHGIPVEVLEKVKNVTHAFFTLPPKEKLKYNKKHSPSTNVRYTTSFVPEAESALEWKDNLSFFYVSDEEAHALWPSMCRDEVLDYIQSCEPLVKRLLGILMKRLNVTEIDEAKQSLLMGSRRVNLNYYPKCPEPELTVGVGRHSDVSTFTILLQDDIGGLYVRKLDDGSWINVAPVNGALVINIGDALQIMSNGRYKSIEHRVIANKNENRMSVPLFVNPNPSEIIGPLSEVLATSGEKPIYKQVLYADYTRHFFRKAHRGKDTIEFAKI
ncbi:hypothetical protein ACH5RR_021706 [Cinchona calisaya]|uniref:feruloyl-CoA 6-hydroxylase n=1 Tax=Cinchona calisaya TaxID=153742 RepID=A0ABD2ZI39_9GENT